MKEPVSAHKTGFSVTLADEYIAYRRQFMLNSYYQLYLIISTSLPTGRQGFTVRLLFQAEGSQNISTAESPDLAAKRQNDLNDENILIFNNYTSNF
jgi:hypothetical protein